jgi:hypothetical protein
MGSGGEVVKLSLFYSPHFGVSLVNHSCFSFDSGLLNRNVDMVTDKDEYKAINVLTEEARVIMSS